MEIAAQHLLSLVNDVLQMSKLNDGTTIIAHEPFNLREAIEDVKAIISGNAVEAGIIMEYEKYDFETYF